MLDDAAESEQDSHDDLEETIMSKVVLDGQALSKDARVRGLVEMIPLLVAYLEMWRRFRLRRCGALSRCGVSLAALYPCLDRPARREGAFLPCERVPDVAVRAIRGASV